MTTFNKISRDAAGTNANPLPYPSSGFPSWVLHSRSSGFKTSRKTIQICSTYRSTSVPKKQRLFVTSYSSRLLAVVAYRIRYDRYYFLPFDLLSALKTENLYWCSLTRLKQEVGSETWVAVDLGCSDSVRCIGCTVALYYLLPLFIVAGKVEELPLLAGILRDTAAGSLRSWVLADRGRSIAFEGSHRFVCCCTF